MSPHPGINLLSSAKPQKPEDFANPVISDARRMSQNHFVLPMTSLRFGVFEVNPRERELRKLGLRIRLQQKPFQVLMRLLQTPGEFVAREELARLLWPNLHVLFDRSLNTAVNALRRALGDDGRNPRFIETRPGLGYVFIGSVEHMVEPAAERHAESLLHATQTNAPQTNANPNGSAAHQEYLKGRYFAGKMTDADFRKSVAYYESALAHDSNCALAHAGLADTWMLFGFYDLLPPNECFARARKSAETALRIDDLLSEAHTSIAAVKQLADWNWPGAESSFQRALKLNSNNPAVHRHYARHLAARGRFAEAVKEIGAAQQLDSLSLVINAEMAWILFMSRDFSGAAEQSWKTLAMEPRFALAQNTLGLAYWQLGMVEDAIVELDNARVCSENHPWAIATLAHVLAAAGKRDEAQEWLAEMNRMSATRRVDAYWFGVVHAGLEDFDLALDSLDQACRERSPWLEWLDVDPRFDQLRKRARFDDIRRRIGFEQASEVSE
jgi:DNA-binding winged helix-turn-helix (wHTH) protein/Flp pilus assembly protein TadD